MSHTNEFGQICLYMTWMNSEQGWRQEISFLWGRRLIRHIFGVWHDTLPILRAVFNLFVSDSVVPIYRAINKYYF